MTEPSDRRDDWKRGVDENLASLNAAQRVWDRELVVIRKLLGEFDRLLRGDIEKDTDGLISRIHYQENEVNLLKAVLLKDKAGGKGLVGRVEDIENGEKRADRKLKVWIAVLSLLSALLATLASNFDRLDTYFKRKSDPVANAIDRAKRPKGKPIVKFRIIHEDDQEPEIP